MTDGIIGSYLIYQPIHLINYLNDFHVNILPDVSDLDIGVPRRSEQVGDTRSAHRGGDSLAGGLNAGQQLGQVTSINKL